MLRMTRFVIRHRKKIIVGWVVAFLLGGAATSGLGDLLTNRFSVPGSDAEHGLNITKQRLAERGEGAFTLIVAPKAGGDIKSPAFRQTAEQAASRAARVLKNGKAGPLQPAGARALYAQVTSALENQDAAKKVPAVRRAIGSVPGATTYLSGYPALNHDLQPLYNEDLVKGEMIALPIALIVLAFMFGTLAAIAVPFVFMLITIPTTLGFVWIFANLMDMANYVQNIVTLIGIAIAIDYSMLVVFRFREELERDENPHEALEVTMATAGRAALFSGATVAIGLGLLVLMPLPFMRSMGIGGILVPLVSIAAAATFLPALLAVMGRKINRLRFVPSRVLERRARGETGFWTRLANMIMRRPIPVFVGASLLMIALALPATELRLTGGDNRGTPITTEASRGLKLLEDTLGPGALAPNQLVVDTGRRNGAFDPAMVAAQLHFVAAVRGNREVLPSTVLAPAQIDPRAGPPDAGTLARLRQAGLVDPTGRVFQIRFAGRSDSGTDAARHLVHQVRDDLVPGAGFGADRAFLTGAPAFGVDFIDKAYNAFPWLVVAVLIISYLVLLRAFRSVVLPLKAVVMNLLSVSATYGVLVLVFQKGIGQDLGVFQQSDQIEAWIPIFLFAMLFGLSMDYEVFLLARIREEWDRGLDNARAVASGLEHTGRIITAAAIIMIAAFSGFTAGSFVGLQEFGLGLSAAILLDATIVRALLVPALMELLGDWNWYLPERVRRTLRLAPGRAAFARGAGDGQE
jgi:RND superfamily putative drug exporter